MAHQPAISSSISFQPPFNRAGGRTSNVGQEYMQEENPERDTNKETQGANTKSPSNLGCGFFGGLLLIVVGMVFWAVLYALVMQHYEVKRPGGHHFGGGDLAGLEAIAAGIIAGPFVGLAICSLCFRGLRFFRLPLASIFLIFPVSHAVKDFSKYRKEYEARTLISKAVSDPQLRRYLVSKAREGSISRGERWAIAQAIYSGSSFSDEDISFLIKYFSDDVSVVDPLLRYKGVTEEDKRAAYETHKLDSGHSRISELLVESGTAPLDILEDIAEHNSRYPRSHRYSERLILRAQDQLDKRKPNKARLDNPLPRRESEIER